MMFQMSIGNKCQCQQALNLPSSPYLVTQNALNGDNSGPAALWNVYVCIRRIGPILWIGKCPEFMNIEWLVYFAKETGMDHAACLLVHALLGLDISPDKYLSYFLTS